MSSIIVLQGEVMENWAAFYKCATWVNGKAKILEELGRGLDLGFSTHHLAKWD